jgi:tetratricopeptide (TPR) repeat protein
MTMAHLLKAYLHLLGTDPAGAKVAIACCEAAAQLEANDRERRHLEAATLLAHSRWYEAGRALEDISVLYPRDLVALQVGHQVDFFTGDSRMLRDRIARAMPAWDRGMHGCHSVLGMYAFGLEETGDYAQAEKNGRLCVELEPRDGWGWHAVAHVLEMRNQPAAGIAWLQPHLATWSEGSFLAVHNWWHLALFHLTLGDTGEALRLYDSAISQSSVVVLDMIDASAMLWRLQLEGVDVGNRWDALADRWASAGAGGHYAFNDMHAMMAFACTGRSQAQRDLLEAQRQAIERDDDNAAFTRDVGYPAALAIQAYVQGDFAVSAESLRRIRSRAHRFGGSHAQRDVIDLTLLSAARLSGNKPLAAALEYERSCLRPRPTEPKLALAA